MARRLPSAIFVSAVVLMSFGGCASEPGEESADPLVVIAGPKAFSSFELRDGDDRLIWRLVADDPAPVAELFYGEIPAGFRQETPAGHDWPRPLVEGELLTLRSITPLRVFHHEGWVDSGPRLSVEHWEVALRNPPAPADLDDPPPPS